MNENFRDLIYGILIGANLTLVPMQFIMGSIGLGLFALVVAGLCFAAWKI